MRVSRLAAVVVAIAIGVTPSVAAQQSGAQKGLEVVKNPTRRNGFWGTMGFGVGMETFSVAETALDPGWLAKPTFNMRIGGTPDVHLRLGGEWITWHNGDNYYDQTLGGMAGIAQIYPSVTQGFFLKGGGGYAWNSIGGDYYCYYYCYSYTYAYDTGFMWTAGAGFEIPASWKVNIVPTVDYYVFYFGDRNTGNYTERLWNFGVAVGIP